MSDNQSLTLSEEGLELPEAFQDVDGQLVIRTPRSTIQHFAGGVEGDHYPLIDESHFGDADSFTNPQNPNLAPNTVSLKVEGEDAETYTINQHA